MSFADPESAVLSCVMISPDVCWPMASEHLRSSDFASERHAKIFDLMHETALAGYTLNTMTLAKSAVRHGLLPLMGTIAGLPDIEPTANHFASYLRILIEDSIMRQKTKVENEVQTLPPRERLEKLDQFNAESQERLQWVVDGYQQITESTLGAIAKDALQRRFDNDGQRPYIPLAIEWLDQVTNYSCGEGDTIVIGAEPGHGKTLFMLQALERCAESGRKCVLYSYEMGSQAIGDRILAMLHEDMTGNKPFTDDNQKLRIGNEVRDMIERWAGNENIIFRKISPKPDALARDMRRMKMNYGVSVAAIDYLGMISGEGTRYQSQTEAINGIQIAAVSSGVACLVGCQITRPTDKTKAFVPTVRHLKDSGQIDAAANCVILLRYPSRDPAVKIEDIKNEYIDADGNDPLSHLKPEEVYEVRIGKIRNGKLPKKLFPCAFQESPLRIVDHRDRLRNSDFEYFNNREF